MSSTGEQHILEERFGPLLSISDGSLTSLASNIRKATSTDHFTTAKCISRLNGSYNLVHIFEFNDGHILVIRIPATGWADQFTESAKRALLSQALTMHHSSFGGLRVRSFDVELDPGAVYRYGFCFWGFS